MILMKHGTTERVMVLSYVMPQRSPMTGTIELPPVWKLHDGPRTVLLAKRPVVGATTTEIKTSKRINAIAT